MTTSGMFPQRDSGGPNFEDVKARTSIAGLIGRTVALKKRGHELVGLCPFHNEKTPSFKVNEAKKTFHCFGCGVHGDVFDYLRRAQGMELREAFEYLENEAGMTPDREGSKRPTQQPMAPPQVRDDSGGRMRAALDIWCKSRDPIGTLTGAYLNHRNITGAIPATLRDHIGLNHSPTGQNLPAMVAAITGPDRKVMAIQRTFLRCDGRSKANVNESKMTLGSMGAGAVRLGPAGPVLGIAEGVETGLSAMELFDVPVWCSLSASRLDRLWLPPESREIHIFGDNGAPGHEAAESAARVYLAQGRRVVVRFPPERFGDYNDLLRSEVAA